MKIHYHNNLSSVYRIVFILIVPFLLSSCLKKSGPDASSIVSAITVINASPNSPTLEFVLDNQRVQEFSYPDKKIPYFAAFSGSRMARIYEAGNLNLPLYELELRLMQGNYYSLFISGNKNALGSLMVEDDLSPTTPGNAKIRFINLSPDAPALDFKIDDDNILASNKKFREYTGFQELKAGDYNAIIESHDGDAANEPFDLTVEDGKIYTIWAKGLVESTVEEEKFGYSILVHSIN